MSKARQAASQVAPGDFGGIRCQEDGSHQAQVVDGADIKFQADACKKNRRQKSHGHVAGGFFDNAQVVFADQGFANQEGRKEGTHNKVQAQYFGKGGKEENKGEEQSVQWFFAPQQGDQAVQGFLDIIAFAQDASNNKIHQGEDAPKQSQFEDRDGSGGENQVHGHVGAFEANQNAQDGEGQDIVKNGDRNNLLADDGVDLAQVHEDSNAHGEGGDGHTESNKKCRGEVLAKPHAHGDATEDGDGKSGDRYNNVTALEGSEDIVDVDFESGPNHQQENTEFGNDLDFFGAMYQVQQAGTQEDAGQDFADHGGLAESFQHLAQ